MGIYCPLLRHWREAAPRMEFSFGSQCAAADWHDVVHWAEGDGEAEEGESESEVCVPDLYRSVGRFLVLDCGQVPYPGRRVVGYE